MFLEEAQGLLVAAGSNNNPSLLSSSHHRVTAATTDHTQLSDSTDLSQQQLLAKDGRVPTNGHRGTKLLRLYSSQTVNSRDEHGWRTKLARSSENGLGMTCALFLTYFAVMGAKCALPSTFSLLTSSETGLLFPKTAGLITPSQQMSRVLTLSTVAIALGKLVLGFVIDRCGGVRSLKIALCALSVLMARIATAQTFNVFAVSWILVDFIFSACWPACIKAIHEFFPPNQWVSSIGMLVMAARIGNAAAFSSFALLLSWVANYNTSSSSQPWRYVFGASSAIQLIPLILLTYFGSPKQPAQDTTTEYSNNATLNEIAMPKDSSPSILSIIRKQLTSVRFWLHLTSRSCLMIFISFLMFVPTYMKSAYGMTSSAAAQVASVFALGCLLSVTVGSKPYSSSTTGQRTTLLSTFLGCATLISFVQLSHVSGIIRPLSPLVGTICMFAWGFAASLPFYIPPSLFALEHGGKASSATIADLFDVTGFLLLARFNGYVASIPHSILSEWRGTFIVTTACSAVSLCSLALATSLEGGQRSRGVE